MTRRLLNDQNLSPILARVDRARQLLAQAGNAIEAKKVADMAFSAKVFAIKQKSLEAKEFAHTVWIDALRLEGLFLKQQPKNNGAKGVGKSVVPNGHRTPTLAETGITKKESATAQLVNKAAEKAPELFGNVRAGLAKLNDIRRHFKKEAHKEKLANVSASPKPIAQGPFNLILADPPWRYEHCEADNREIENQYPTMDLAAIKAHVPNATRDSILFLWATAPKLDEALQVMIAWGFNYRSCAIWDKQKIGMGYWFRVQHELLLVGTRGKPECTPECERISSIFSEKRTKHSVKPICVYEWIEKAFPGATKQERYCRAPRSGWAVEGNEV